MDAAWKRTIEELLAKAKAGDEVALNELLCRIRAWCFSIAYAILRNGHDAEDAVQDALMEMAKHMAQCNITFEGWACAIVHYKALAILRRGSRSLVSDPDVVGGIAQSSREGMAECDRTGRAQVLANAILHLSEDMRNVVILFYFQGCSVKEILPLLVKEFLASYIGKAGRFKNFQEYFTLEGKRDLQESLRLYAKVPGFEEDKNYYFDWGADSLFSLAERKAGECSAGFFDLLEMDLKNIKNAQEGLAKNAQDDRQKEKLLGELVFYASRALLITRGLDAKSQEEVYAGFLKHFIETGLIDASFREIITIAERGDSKEILVKQSQALELAKAVQALYETMDNSFNFKTTSAVPQSHQKEAVAAIVKDFRGVACPLNFVKTKVELAKLKPQELLEIWLDDGAPIENVPGSVKAEGHKVLAQKRIGDYWSVIIEKK